MNETNTKANKLMIPFAAGASFMKRPDMRYAMSFVALG
jgi:hypothetical protein